AALPKLPLAGPAIGHSWLSQLVGFIRTATSRLRIVTFHSYAINSTGAAFRGRNCSTATSDPAYPTPATLLAPFASEGLMPQAAPAGSTLEPVTQTNGANVEAWATMARDHRVRVMLINHSLTATQSVLVRVPVARGNALLDRLRAPSVKSTAGMTLSGQSFG